MSVDSRKIKAARVSVVAAVSLAILKLGAALATGSIAVLSSGVDSLLDILMSGANYVAIRHADQPPDHNHPFGHGKFEALATVFQAVVISCSGLWLLVESIRRLLQGAQPSHLNRGLVVLCISSLVSWLVARYLRRTAEATGSSALRADSLHFSMDIYTNLALMVGLAVMIWWKITWLDPVLSIGVAGYILFEALRLVRFGMADMLDEHLPESELQEITNLLSGHWGFLPKEHRSYLLDYHKLRTRRAGSLRIIDCHLTVCKHLSVGVSHDIVHQIEQRIQDSVQAADVTIHVDPCDQSGRQSEPSCPKKCLEELPVPG